VQRYGALQTSEFREQLVAMAVGMKLASAPL
jgi:hypothetical protein